PTAADRRALLDRCLRRAKPSEMRDRRGKAENFAVVERGGHEGHIGALSGMGQAGPPSPIRGEGQPAAGRQGEGNGVAGWQSSAAQKALTLPPLRRAPPSPL